MAEAISPKSGYLVTTSAAISQLNNRELAEFYQPLMSTAAFALIQLLRTELQPHPNRDQLRRHSHLLALLNVGLNTLTEARNQLEALELLRTFYVSDGEQNFFVYDLQAQLTPRQLLSDDLLSTLLLQNVGPEHFERLVDLAGQYQYDVENLDEDTHSFFDVFQPDQAELGRDEKVLKNAKQSLKLAAHERVVQLPTDGFNYGVLAQQLRQDGVASEDLQKYRELITTNHLLYGLDEGALRKLVLQAVDWGVKNSFQPRRFQLAVAASQGQRKAPATVETKPALAEPQKESQQLSLSTEEQQLLAVAKKLAPLQFLATLKKQTGGGFVTSNERYIIANLIKMGMATDVINILSYYVIINQELPTLRKNLVDTIANSWQRAGITDAIAALKEVGQHQKRAQKSTKRRSASRYRQRGQVKEKLPAWAQTSADNHPKATDEQLAESKKLLQSLHRKQKHNHKEGGPRS